MPIDAAGRYDPLPDRNLYCQGDVLEHLPVIFTPPSGERWVLLRPGRNVTLDQARRGTIPGVFKPSVERDTPNAWEGQEELVVALATKERIVLLTQTCDIDHRKYLQVAPVRPAEGLGEDKLASLRTDEIKHWFYLPPDPPEMPESYVDIAKVTSIHTSYLPQAQLIRRHKNSGIVALQKKLAEYFGRPFGFNTRDTVPQTADYMCVRCFYELAKIHRAAFPEQTKFGNCPNCGDEALWVKCPIVDH